MIPDHLRQATQRRTSEADKRVRDALRDMIRDGTGITFVSVAAQARVSTDFLYRHPSLRQKITQLRHRGPHTPIAASTTAATDAGGVVRVLTSQLRDLKAKHRQEVQALQDALAAAHGENLALRRSLDAHPAPGVTVSP